MIGRTSAEYRGMMQIGPDECPDQKGAVRDRPFFTRRWCDFSTGVYCNVVREERGQSLESAATESRHAGTEEALSLGHAETEKALSEILSEKNADYVRARHKTSLDHLKKLLWTGTHGEIAQQFQAMEHEVRAALPAVSLKIENRKAKIENRM